MHNVQAVSLIICRVTRETIRAMIPPACLEV